MKRVTILTAFLISTTLSYSQIFQGQWMVGGTTSLESGKLGDFDESKYTSFQLNPNAGYLFINNLAGGVRLSFETTKFKEDEEATSSFLIAPFARYYFLPAQQKVNVFADASYGFGSMKDGESDSFNQFAIAAGPAIFLSRNTALEFAVQYTSAGGDAYPGDDRMNAIGVNVGFQVHLGNSTK
jgi:hypothetical protein